MRLAKSTVIYVRSGLAESVHMQVKGESEHTAELHRWRARKCSDLGSGRRALQKSTVIYVRVRQFTSR